MMLKTFGCLCSVGVKIYLYPFWVCNFLIQRILTYDYNTSYYFRDKLYKLINVWNSRLNKHILCTNDLTNSAELCSELCSQGILLNDFDIDLKKANILLDLLSKMRKKEIKSPTGVLQKVVYSQADILQSLEFLELASSPRVVKVATQYFGVPPIIAFVSAWKTLPSSSETNEMFFHMDHHGHKFLKLFYYLNDVEIGSGHHEYCTSTHNQIVFDELIASKDNSKNHFKNAILSKRKYQGGLRLEESLIGDFIPESILQIGGKAGTSFLEDTRGIHRGTLLQDGSSRTIFQVLYLPNANFKENPLNLPVNNALHQCRESSTLHHQVFRRLFSNVFSKHEL